MRQTDKRLPRLVAVITAAASCTAAADILLEHRAHGGLVSFDISDCMLNEQRRYSDAAGAEASNYVQGHAIDMREVSVWIRRPDGSSSSAFRVTDRCESWRDADQCISLETAHAVAIGQEIRLACDEMYVSCVRANHFQGNFTLHDGFGLLSRKEDDGPANVRMQQEILTTLYHNVESCKDKSGIRETAFREDAEGAVLRAQDRIREVLQNLEPVFRQISTRGPIFAPAVCGEVRPAGQDTFLRFVVFGPIGVKLEGARKDSTFNLKYWEKYCN